jgi:hypothetical protein
MHGVTPMRQTSYEMVGTRFGQKGRDGRSEQYLHRSLIIKSYPALEAISTQAPSMPPLTNLAASNILSAGSMHVLLLMLSPNRSAAGSACSSTPWLNHGWLGCYPDPKGASGIRLGHPPQGGIECLPLPVHRVSPHAGRMRTVHAYYKVP